MVSPCIEVTVAKVGKNTVEDESSEAGKKYMTAFYKAATTIPGCTRGAWGRSDKYSDYVVHFLGMCMRNSSSKDSATNIRLLDYNSRKEHDVHKALIGGPAPPILDGLQSDTHVYVIHPNTDERKNVYFAPYNSVFFFWGIKEDQWGPVAKRLFAEVEKNEHTNGLIWGQIEKPVLSDPSGFSELGSGKCAVAVVGWKSKDLHDKSIAQSEFASAWKAVDEACEKTEDWGTSLHVTEQTGHIHSWRTPFPTTDASN